MRSKEPFKLVAAASKEKLPGQLAYKHRKGSPPRHPAGCDEEVETSGASDERVVLALSGNQEMVEDSRKRKAASQQRLSTNLAVDRNGASAPAAGNTQDSFAAFASQYKDVLRFADADEAEAVYSMVALTQGRAPPAAGAVADVPEGRPPKRQQVAAPAAGRAAPAAGRAAPAAVPAHSEGGSSDSSAKSAPSPVQQQQQAAGPGGPFYPGMVPSMMMQMPPMPGMQMQMPLPQQMMQAHPGAAGGDVGGNNMCMASSMPMVPSFFPPGMMGMPGGPPGCPMPPFLPPWAVPPAMMPMMFGSMPMFGCGPVPPGSPQVMPMAPNGMPIPGMPPMPPAFMPGLQVSGAMAAPCAVGEPAAGIPVSGPVPAAMQPGSLPSNSKAAGAPATGVPAMPGTGAAVVRKPATAHKKAGNSTSPKLQQQQQQQQPPKRDTPSPVAAPTTGASPSSSVAPPTGGKIAATAAAAGAQAHASSSPPAAVGAGAAAEAAAAADVHQELAQLDVVALKPWVMSHFCEDVYLLLLDVWRPDSPKVRDAIWSWKLHVQLPRPGGSQPDYRAFLVSLFGLERLLQLTAAEKVAAATAGSGGGAAGATMGANGKARLPLPLHVAEGAVAAAAAGAALGTAGSSSAADTALAAASGRVLGSLTPTGTVVGSATSPHVAGMTVQPQPA